MISIKPTTRWPNEPPNWWPIRIHELGQQTVGQLSKANRQQVVEEIRHQTGDRLSVTIRQQPADEKGQQAADQLEKLSVFGTIAIKRVFLRPKTKGKCS